MRSFIVLSIFYFVVNIANAQTSGNISGRIIDLQTKQPLPGANVLVAGSDRGAATDESGNFSITNIEENIYKVRVSYIGYQEHFETDVRVIRGKTTMVEDIELVLSAVTSVGVTVTGNAINEETRPVSSYISTRDVIMRAPGAGGDIFRAIESMPGVSTSGGEFSAFSVRGGSPRDNIILVDNIPFGKLTHFDGGNEEEQAQGGRFSVFAPGVVEEANFQGGGFDAQNGGKFSSLLDLTIREGNQKSFTLDARADVLGWELNYSGPTYLLNNTSLFLSARHQDFNRILELTDQKDNGSPRFTDIIAKTTTDISARHKLSFLAIFAPEWFDRKTKHVFESDDFAETSLVRVREPKTLVGANWRFLTSKSSYWQNTFYYGKSNNHVDFGFATPLFLEQGGPQSPADITQRIYLHEDIVDTEYGWRTAFNYFPARNTTFLLGADLSRKEQDLTRRMDAADTLYTFDENDFRPNPSLKYIVRQPEFVNVDFDAGKLFLATYGQFSFKPVSGVTVNLGLRHEFNEFNKDHYISPRGSINYFLNDRTRLSFASGLYTQEPEINDFTAAAQNLNLKNEKSLHTILGVTNYLRDDLKLTVEGYYKQFDDLLVEGDRANNISTNNGDGHAYGVDFILVKRFIDKFYGQVSYSYAVSKRNDNDGEGEYDSDFNQPNIFSIIGGYEFNKEWSLSAKWRYATGRPTDSFVVHNDIFGNPNFVRYSKEINENNGHRLPAFHTFNIRVDYRKQLGRIALVSFIDVVNLYSHLNVNEARFLYLTGGVDERGFEILPTMGLKLEL